MARLRRQDPQQRHSGIPAALADPAAAEWHDARLFAALVDDLALDLADPWPDCRPATPCSRRRAAAVHRWALLNGYTSNTWPGTPDHERLRLIGLDDLRTRSDCPHERPTPRRRTTMKPTPKENPR